MVCLHIRYKTPHNNTTIITVAIRDGGRFELYFKESKKMTK